MANLGDIGKARAVNSARRAFPAFGRNAAASVEILITGAVPNTNLFLFTRAGMSVDQTAADSAGEARFYDMDNGIYTIYAAGTGDVWQATVTTGSAVVVKRFTSNRAQARAWIG